MCVCVCGGGGGPVLRMYVWCRLRALHVLRACNVSYRKRFSLQL